MNVLRTVVYWWVRWWLKIQFRFQVEGGEVFRRTPQFILIANHTSHLDAICLLAALPRAKRNRCYSAAAEDYFYTNVVKEQIARLLANTFPFRRHAESRRGLEACARILERGDSLIFFPEGTRSTTGEMQRFRKGIGILVQGTRYPVIPAYLQGTGEALAKGRFYPTAARIQLRVGDPETFEDALAGEASILEITERLEARVRELGRMMANNQGDPDER
jgi:1-acyl-sn-glycerol-3-phosphate acyltransferase